MVFGWVAAAAAAAVVVMVAAVVFVALVAWLVEHWIQPWQQPQRSVGKRAFALVLAVARETDWLVEVAFLAVTWPVGNLLVEDASDFDPLLAVVVAVAAAAAGSNSKAIGNYYVGPAAAAVVVTEATMQLDHSHYPPKGTWAVAVAASYHSCCFP